MRSNVGAGLPAIGDDSVSLTNHHAQPNLPRLGRSPAQRFQPDLPATPAAVWLAVPAGHPDRRPGLIRRRIIGWCRRFAHGPAPGLSQGRTPSWPLQLQRRAAGLADQPALRLSALLPPLILACG